MDIEVKGLKELVVKLAAQGEAIEPMLERVIHRGVLYLQQKVPPYPPPPSDAYRRTGTLGRSITSWKGQNEGALSEVRGGGSKVEGIIGTAIPYAQAVIGDQQTRPHRGRWWQLRRVVAANAPGVVRIMENYVQDWLRIKG